MRCSHCDGSGVIVRGVERTHQGDYADREESCPACQPLVHAPVRAQERCAICASPDITYIDIDAFPYAEYALCEPHRVERFGAAS